MRMLPSFPPHPVHSVDPLIAAAVHSGLSANPKTLPAWLFYDAEGSRLFEQITALPEYYLTRTEHGIFLSAADQILAKAADGRRLRIAELGAGSATKTQILLREAMQHQHTLVYRPVDVSAEALEAARERIEQALPTVTVQPLLADYTKGLALPPATPNERWLVLYIGSSIGNFYPEEATALLQRIRAALRPGDAFLLGVDLVKDEATLVAAYDDAAGVTAAFNRNILARLNRELGAKFPLDAFAHHAVWNPSASRMEMHLVCKRALELPVAALGCAFTFATGETIHTENSYKYYPGQAEQMLQTAGFAPLATWTDPCGWFAVSLARAE
jgi:L-histidine N-alpha-methyltransferase